MATKTKKMKRVDHPCNCGNCKLWKKTGKKDKDGHPLGICGRAKRQAPRPNYEYCVGVVQRKKSRI